MRRAVGILSLLLIIFSLLFISCEHNVYMGEPEKVDGLWKVNGIYFDSLQEAMDYIYGTTKGLGNSKAIEDVPITRIAVLQRNVYNGERGGGLIVPADFEGQLVIDFNGFTYEFDNSLDHFFDIRGGDEVYIINGTTVIYNEASHTPFALAVNTDTVTIDDHLIDDRRWDPKLFDVGEKGTLKVLGIQATDTACLTGIISVVTDGTTGGKLILEYSRVVITNILTRYKNAEGEVEDKIPEATAIPADARSEITISSGYVTINNIETLSDYYKKEGTEPAELYSKAILKIFSDDATNITKIENPHDSAENPIDTAIQTIIDDQNAVTDPDVDHVVIHDFSEWTVIVQPTCTEAGTEQRTCNYCGLEQNRAVEALGHDWSSEWESDVAYHWHTCTRDEDHKGEYSLHTFSEWQYDENNNASRYCTVCGRVDTLVHTHTVEHVEAHDATCTSDGNKEYWKCSDCGLFFLDSQASTPTTPENVIIKATGHDWDTGWTYDSTDHWHVCLNGCGATSGTAVHSFSDWTYSSTDGKDHRGCDCGYTEERTHVHVLTEHPAVEATCETDGNYAYWECTKCSKYYSDAAGTIETTLPATVIEKLGHNYSSAWSFDDNNHWRVCLNDSSHKSDTGAHTYPEDWTYDPDLNANVKACTVCGRKIIESHTTHTSDDSWVNTDPDQHYKVCSVCGTHYDHEDHSFSEWAYDSVLNKDKRTCSVCDRVETRTHIHGTEDDENLIHYQANDATCTANGNKEYWECTLCNRYYLDEACTIETTLEDTVIAKLGHKITIHEQAHDATCTEVGNIEYWYCDRCCKYFSDENYTTEVTLDQTLIEALGHLPATITKDSYEFDDDYHWVVCLRDPEHYAVSKANHIWGPEHPCSDGNHMVRECTVCGVIRNADEPGFDEYHISIGTIVIPTVMSSPCGEIEVDRDGETYTVRYVPHLNSNTTYDLYCQWYSNGHWSSSLPQASDGSFSFSVTDDRSYKIVLQAVNEGGTLTLEKIVNE